MCCVYCYVFDMCCVYCGVFGVLARRLYDPPLSVYTSKSLGEKNFRFTVLPSFPSSVAVQLALYLNSQLRSRAVEISLELVRSAQLLVLAVTFGTWQN